MTALALLTNRYVLAGLGLAALLAFGGIQTARLHYEHRARLHDRAAMAVRLIEAINDQVMLRANVGTLEAALQAQSAAVRQQSARSAAALQDASRALAEARAGERNTQRRLDALSRPTAGATVLDRANDAARRAREALG